MAETFNMQFGDLPEDPLENTTVWGKSNPDVLEFDRIRQEAELSDFYDSISYTQAKEGLEKFIKADSNSMAEFFETKEEFDIFFSGVANNIKTVCLLGSKLSYEDNGIVFLPGLSGDARDFRYKLIPERNNFWCALYNKYPGRPRGPVAEAYLPLNGNEETSSIFASKFPTSFDEKKTIRYNPQIDHISEIHGYIDTVNLLVSNLVDLSPDK